MRDYVRLPSCVFCDIVAGDAPAQVVRRWNDATAFIPLDPVVPDGGHVLVVPNDHIRDVSDMPVSAADTMVRAIELASAWESFNVITSAGKAATQSIFHLHWHIVRREPGDQLMVPWGTTGDPHAPHRCKGMDALEAQLRRREDS